MALWRDGQRRFVRQSALLSRGTVPNKTGKDAAWNPQQSVWPLSACFLRASDIDDTWQAGKSTRRGIVADGQSLRHLRNSQVLVARKRYWFQRAFLPFLQL
jgi:hypothetical protein